MNQFFYTTKDQNDKEVLNSFNPEKVVRTYGQPDGTRVVILDDIHEEYIPLDIPTGKGTATKREVRKMDVSSQIFLSEEDNKKFLDIYNK